MLKINYSFYIFIFYIIYRIFLSTDQKEKVNEMNKDSKKDDNLIIVNNSNKIKNINKKN